MYHNIISSTLEIAWEYACIALPVVMIFIRGFFVSFLKLWLPKSYDYIKISTLI